MATRTRMQLRFADAVWFDQLTDAQLGILVRGLLHYAEHGTEPVLKDPLIKLAFGFLRTVDDEDARRYQQVCERNTENGKKGGRPRKDDPENGKETAEKPTAFFETQKTQSQSQSQSQTQSQSQGQSQTQSHGSSPDEAKPAGAGAPVIVLETKENSFFSVTKEQRDQWAGAYPRIRVDEELKKMGAWLAANPCVRPPKQNMLRWCNAWLARQEERIPAPPVVDRRKQIEEDRKALAQMARLREKMRERSADEARNSSAVSAAAVR